MQVLLPSFLVGVPGNKAMVKAAHTVRISSTVAYSPSDLWLIKFTGSGPS